MLLPYRNTFMPEDALNPPSWPSNTSHTHQHPITLIRIRESSSVSIFGGILLRHPIL
jgi:hypothetical protein